MTAHAAFAVMQALGPCRVVHKDAPDLEALEYLLLQGCSAWATGSAVQGRHRRAVVSLKDGLDPDSAERPAIDAVIVSVPPGGDVVSVLEPFLDAPSDDPLTTVPTLVIEGDGLLRAVVDTLLFSKGWRRHPADMTTRAYAGYQDHLLTPVSLYQRLPAQAHRWSVNDLLPERPLHMDMLREGGCRADAHIVRYAWAAEHIRPGDTVLDCACGLGYGTAVMASLSKGGIFIGVDLSPETIGYASVNYGHPGVSFRADDAAVLASVPDASVDVVVSMETIEHVEDWQATLDAFRRVLKPDGRLIASVPDQWGDETGHDPNPHHHHVFDWPSFSAALSERFIIEGRYGQTAPGGTKLQRAPRRLLPVPFESTDEHEWILVVASVNPLESGAELKDRFAHPAFDAALAASGLPVVDFANGYDNPSLYRPLVQMGERIGDAERLFRLANLAASLAVNGSADQGAAYCVMGYQAIEHRNVEVATELVPLIAAYESETRATAAANPHVRRWRVSLAFLAGRLSSLLGQDDAALEWYRRAATEPWGEFSPLLATKAVGACFYAAVLCLANGRDEQARQWFADGLDTALQSLASPSEAIIGSCQAPVPFALQEMGEVADMGGQCALALSLWDSLARDRGAFWRQIDVKRFGVIAWAKEMERMNASLRKRIEVLRQTQHLTAATVPVSASSKDTMAQKSRQTVIPAQ